jgi:hypothetical protein
MRISKGEAHDTDRSGGRRGGRDKVLSRKNRRCGRLSLLQVTSMGSSGMYIILCIYSVESMNHSRETLLPAPMTMILLQLHDSSAYTNMCGSSSLTRLSPLAPQYGNTLSRSYEILTVLLFYTWLQSTAMATNLQPSNPGNVAMKILCTVRSMSVSYRPRMNPSSDGPVGLPYGDYELLTEQGVSPTWFHPFLLVAH